MSFRRAAFGQAGLFDSSVGRTFISSRPLGCEETEFSIRLRRLSPGARIIYEPQAVVYHHVDQSRATWRYFLGRCSAEGAGFTVSDKWDADPAAGFRRRLGEAAHVSIRYTDGTSLDATEKAATGSLARPMSDAALREKFATLARYGCPALDVGPLAEKLWALPELGDAGAVMALARPQT